MKQHSYKTLVMLHPITELGDIVSWAANHHERLDGSGYPFRLGAASLDIPSRILAVADVFTAMTENRPYRQGMQSAEALTILREEVANYRLDRDIVALLDHNIDSVKPLVAMC
jgi:HD-GYP domain